MMLSVGVISTGGLAYYFGTVAGGVDDYYVRTEPGRWLGTASGTLGLSGDVERDRLARFLDGQAGATDGRPGGRGVRVAAFDLTFSAPKSVSVLAGLGSDEQRRAVVDAHRRAVEGAVGLVETEAARGRRGHGGAREVATTGVVAAGFDHHTSRAGDPQLHTHVLVANRARGVDGLWGALYGQRLFGWAKTAGYAYQAALRHELTATLGVAWTAVVNGTAEVAGIPDEVTAEFSTRRAQIVAALAAHDATTARAAQVATLATRPPKPDPVDPDVQRRAWQARAVTVGFRARDLDRVTGPARHAAEIDPAGLSRRLAGPAGLTARRSSFDRRAVIEAVCAAAPDGLPAARLAGSAAGVLAGDGFVPTGSPGRLAGPTWTTAELAATEARLLDNVTRRRDRGVAVCAPRSLDAAISARPTLADEQAAMVRALCRSGHGVDVVVGPAGTGKTYALDTARAAWADAGIAVVGTALAARTARALEAGTGIPSATLDHLLADLDRPGPHRLDVLPRRGVVVVDEAGMVGTRKLERLLHAAEQTATKVVLVGDPRQLPEIEAGGALAALAERHPHIGLAVNRRQSEPWERTALADLRHGDPGRAVTALTDHGRITLTASADQARSRLVDDWATAHLAGPSTPGNTGGGPAAVMVAMTRADVDDLNTRTVGRLEALDALDPHRARLAVGETTVFGVGERVMALRNDRRVGIVNGTAGTVTAVHPDDRSLTVQPDTPGAPPVRLPAPYLDEGRLTHGWAVTVHKAQGLTTARAFLLGTDRLYREAGYVALSRATTRTDWYHVTPDTPGHTPARAPDAELTRLLTRSGAQHLATPTQPATNTGPGLPSTWAPPAAPGSAARTDDSDRQAAVLADPGTHLTDTLGPPPLSGPGRTRWAATALVVDDYRHRHRVGGPDPLGPRPAGHDRQAREWDRARIAVAQGRRELAADLDRSTGLDR